MNLFTDMNIKKIIKRVSVSAFIVVGLSFTISLPTFAATSLLTESFTVSSTVPGQWTYGRNNIYLTAGSSSTPAGSVPACNSTAIDAPGSGVLRLTGDNYWK